MMCGVVRFDGGEIEGTKDKEDNGGAYGLTRRPWLQTDKTKISINSSEF